MSNCMLNFALLPMERNPSAPTVYVVLDKRYTNLKELYKLKLMITYKRVQKFYTIIIPGVPAKMSENDFEKCRSEKPRHPFSEYKDLINQVESDARNVIKDMPAFSFKEFEKLYFDSLIDEKNLIIALESYENDLKLQGRVGTASSYKCARVALKKFLDETKKPDPFFDDITVSFLSSWEEWMISKGTASATVGIYCRNIRTILNKAKETGLLKPEKYPFGKGKYVIPASQNIKKALSLQEIGKIYNYRAEDGSQEHRARDLWLFSYLCNGINFKDIARLRYKNIDGDTITFIRAKTERKLKSNLKPIIVPYTAELKAIVSRWGNRPRKEESLVFPILHENVTPEQERALVQLATNITNKYIKRIAKDCNISKPISTIYARHSFATVMKRSGASLEFISDSLGHSNIATTENYLASFEMETKRKFAKNLVKFK